jgi:hypothetical protein
MDEPGSSYYWVVFFSAHASLKLFRISKDFEFRITEEVLPYSQYFGVYIVLA